MSGLRDDGATGRRETRTSWVRRLRAAAVRRAATKTIANK